MESRGLTLLRLLVEHDPASPNFREAVRDVFHPASPAPDSTCAAEFDFRDVFVQRKLPWGRFLLSVILHGTAAALIWTISLAWIRQQKILDRNAFDQASLVTYTPEEYLPPLDTGAPAVDLPKPQVGEPAYARQPILSVPPEADNRSQTIVAPPDLKLDHDLPLPNIVATGQIAPAVPLDATRDATRVVAPETQVVAPAPEVQVARDRVVQAGMKSEVIAPPPELTQSTKGKVGLMNIGPSEVVGPAPQLTLAEQHAPTRGRGNVPTSGVQPVAPPPSVAAGGGERGRLVALGIHPVAPTGPVAVPAGNRRGTFAANPQGKSGASGTPTVLGRGDGTFHTRGSGLPAGLRVGDSGAREMARLSAPSGDASVVPSEKATELDRQVFGDKLFHTMALNMPNLNSSTGSWVIHFAELEGGQNAGELTAPRSTEKSDPGYPLELIRSNVHGMVSLYAVIDAEGRVTSVRVLNSPDDRLDSYAKKALSLCKFQPAERAGKPVALEALVMIPFRVKRGF